MNTWMGFFGHDMQKNTHIQTNLVSLAKELAVSLRGLCEQWKHVWFFFWMWMFEEKLVQSVLRSIKALKRKMTKADRARINRRFAHRQQNRKVKRVAWICWKPLWPVWNVCFLQNASSSYIKLFFPTDWLPFHPKDYHSKKRHADGSTSWQGGRDLSSSATFTHHFCRELLKCWENRPSADMSDSEMAA